MPKLKPLNPDDFVAIDIHTHAEEPCGMHGDDGYDDFQAQMAEYFKSPNKHPPTVAETAAYYRAKKIAAVIFPVDAERETGFRRYNNYEMLEIAAENSDVLIPFVSIDPHKGKLGVREAKKLIEEFGVKGFKFHPTMQGFYPNDRMAYPLYEAINDGGAIALFHTGQTGVGSGMPGGMGMRLKYSNPMYMDDVAADFPDLKIILAHPSFPWQEEALSVATHKPNVYIDLSGWSPKYFPPILVRYINSILQDKMLFGSDWPVITPDRWMADFAKLEIRDEIRPKVLKANARKLLKIKQLEYTWLRSLMHRYQDFSVVTRESLVYALRILGLKHDDNMLERIMEKYLHLDLYPDAEAALAGMRGCKLAILSNGSPAMLDALVRNSGLDRVLDATISIDSQKVFKPAPEAYSLIKAGLGVSPAEVLFVSSNPWDACGAKAFGLNVAWIERVTPQAMALACATSDLVAPLTMFKAIRTQMDELGIEPDYRIKTLADLPGLLQSLT